MYMMFIDGEVKPGKKDEFVKAWSTQILPLLKKQDGFVDEILLWEGGSHNGCCGLCFWKTKEQAERYQRDVFPQAKNSWNICSMARLNCAVSKLRLRRRSTSQRVRRRKTLLP